MLKKLTYISLVLYLSLMVTVPLAPKAKAETGSISQVTPLTIKPGDTITITGSGFGNTQSSSDVSINYSTIYNVSGYYQSWSDNQIVVTVPSYFTSSGVLKVDVYNFTERKYYTITGPTVYSAPKLTSVTPKVAYPNQEITLSCGSYSLSACFPETRGSVMIGGQSASIKTWGTYSIVVYAPSMNAGTYSVVVTNPVGGQSDPVEITLYAAPTMYSITPTQVVPGVTNMCISGQNFGTSAENWTTNTNLTIGGIAINKASWTDTRICFDVPSTVKQGGTVNLKISGYQVPNPQSYTIGSPSAPNTPSPTGGTRPNDTDVSKQYYLSQINAFNGWGTRSTSENVVVAIIDDGIYINHPDFSGNIWVNPREQVGNSRDDDNNGYIDDIYGWDFISNEGEMTTRGSHGTHVAGIIGAVGNNNQGTVGITWKVKLMPLIVCDSRIGCPRAAATKAIRYAADNGAHVINISLGSSGTTGYSSEFDEAIRYAYNKGVTIVAAAGNGDIEGSNALNSGLGQDTTLIPQSPVCNDNDQNMVIGVGAVDDQGYRTRWSNLGKCVDVYAPGKGIYSPGTNIHDGALYSSVDGTSFSAPMVAGLAALLKGQYPTMPNSEVALRIIRNINKGVIDIAKTLQDPYTPPVVPGTGVHPKGTVLLGSDNRTVYVIGNGSKSGFATPEEYNSQGFAFSDIVKANASDLALPDGPVVPFADGTLVLDTKDGKTIYLIGAGSKRGFTSAEVFTGLGYKFSQAVRGNLTNYITGNPIGSASEPHPEGALIKKGSIIYKVSSGGKQLVPNTKIFNSWKWNSSRVVNANGADLALPDLGSVKFRDGTLLNNNGAIYIVSDGNLRSFPSMSLFNLYGYKSTTVISVTSAEIAGHYIGESVN